MTSAEIAKHLSVDPRSARRYIEALRSELKVELERIPDSDGVKRWRIPDIDVPRRLAIRRTQAYALLASRPLFEALKGSTLYEEIALASSGLLGIARRPGRGPNAGLVAAELEDRFRYVAFAPKDYGERSEDLDTLFQAVADLQPVSLMYPAQSGAYERFTVHPYALLLYKESIFTLALDPRTSDVRTLELDFVRGSRMVDDQRFELPEGFRVDDYLQGQFGLWRSRGEPTEAVIDFDARISAQITARTFHPSQRVELLPDGSARVRFALGDVSEFAAWAIGFGPLAVVREPASLREQVAESLEAALARYRPVDAEPSPESAPRQRRPRSSPRERSG